MKLFLSLGVIGCCLGAARGESVTIIPTKDNTLIENPTGNNSNALGDGIFSGRSGPLGGGMIFRAALAFDIAGSVPPNSEITGATLSLTIIQAPNLNPYGQTIHRLLQNWGEGTSVGPGGQGAEATPGDVTWLHTFYPDQLWKNAGGDFEPDPSESQFIEFKSLPYVTAWSSPGLLADVQAWYADPQSNFGWIILGDETQFQTSRKFASKDNEVVEFRPQLTIDYVPAAPACPADIAPSKGNGTVDVDDLLAVINSWGICKGQCVADIAPEGGNGTIDVDDLLLVINSWGPCK